MTSDRLIICRNQKEFFEYASDNMLDLYAFIPAFMKSDFCNREIDSFYSVFQYADILEWEDFVKKEIQFVPNPFVKEKIPKKVAGWIGYTYRYIQIESEIPSRDIIEIIPITKLIGAYAGLHTVDEEMAYDIICKDFSLNQIKRRMHGQ